MPSNRAIATELRTLQAGLPEGLTTEFIPPTNGSTFSATVSIITGGPIYINNAIEGTEPNTGSHPINIGDELDVLGTEDLRLLRMMVTQRTDIEITYFGGGDQV